MCCGDAYLHCIVYSGAVKSKRNGSAGVKRNGSAGVKREQVDAIGSAEVEDVEDGDYGMKV